jgi:hypothetical protein
MLMADPAREAEEARRATRQMHLLVERKGIPCVDQASSNNRFMREAAAQLADTPSAEAFAEWMRETLSAPTTAPPGCL